MITKHDCWWTRHYQSEITHVGGAIAGAGCPREVLEYAADLLGTKLQAQRSEADAYGDELSLGGIADGASHDDCFFELQPLSARLKQALMAAVLDLHATYLGRPVDWSGVLHGLVERLGPDVSLRVESRPGRQQLAIRAYPRTAGFLSRAFAKVVVVDCAGPRGVML